MTPRFQNLHGNKALASQPNGEILAGLYFEQHFQLLTQGIQISLALNQVFKT
jgi:hypothetical protein